MSRLTGLLLLVWSLQAYAIPTAEVDYTTGYVEKRVDAIRYLEIAGTRYHVSFDQSFGSNLFDGDPAGADAAVDAIRGVLGTQHARVVLIRPADYRMCRSAATLPSGSGEMLVSSMNPLTRNYWPILKWRPIRLLMSIRSRGVPKRSGIWI